MVDLTLVGLSGDRTQVLLVDDGGQEYSVDVSVLRSALRGVDPRPGHLEIQMDSALRPRDIQARIRAGESPEAVAQAAQAPIERIMPYAAPVLAERAHVAQRAQRSSIRRRPNEGSGSLGGGRTLGDAVESHLRGLQVNPDSVEWDAYRREDGRWTLRAGYQAEGRSRTATFSFDMPGNYVTVDDDAARWLIGDAPATPAPSASPTAPRSTRTSGRRLTAVDSELPLGEDALELVSEESVEDRTEERAQAEDQATSDDLESTLELGATEPEPERESQADSEEEADSETDAGSAAESEPTPKRRGRKRGRASVPSWDEIMFGGGRAE